VKPNVGHSDRAASSDESKAFLRRLREVLEKTQARISKLNSGDYELRIMKVRSHEVVGHSRKEFERPYLAKIRQKRKRPRVNPVAAAIHKTKKRAA